MTKFFTVNKHNTDAWNDIIYCFILRGIIETNPKIGYGEAMNRAQEITNILFKALKKSKGWKK